jgi:hypothetical protein
MKRTLIVSAVITLSLSAASLFAADQPPANESVPTTSATPTTGRQLMTPEERMEHRRKMRAAKTPEERQKLRAEQHEKMKQRAKEQGKTIPETPMSGGMGPKNNMAP